MKMMITIDKSKVKAHRALLNSKLASSRPGGAICYMRSPDCYTVYEFKNIVGNWNIWKVSHHSPTSDLNGRIRVKRQSVEFKRPAGCTNFTDQIIRDWLEYRSGRDYITGRDV